MARINFNTFENIITKFFYTRKTNLKQIGTSAKHNPGIRCTENKME